MADNRRKNKGLEADGGRGLTLQVLKIFIHHAVVDKEGERR